jgi:nicotinamide-nucleotide amidase
MPGVPYEMKRAMTEEIIPKLQKRFQSQTIIHKSILVTGYPESALALKIADWEKMLPDQIRLAYLPQYNIVRLRLSAVGTDKGLLEKGINHQVDLLEGILGEAIIAEEDIPIEQLVGQYLILKNKTVATAESCTGGHIAHVITSVPGSSAYYKGTVVAYSNDVKIKLLQVDKKLIRKYGAVSKEVVEQMAKGVLRSMSTDYAIATSGIAGPDGGSIDKPVGTTWISVVAKDACVTKKFQFSYDRKLNIERATQKALLMLFKLLREEK